MLLLIISCGPENLDPCSPEVLDGNKYLGNATICNAMPADQLDFKAIATIQAMDSILTITLISQDTTVDFQYTTTVSYRCQEAEPNLFTYSLYENNLDVGGIGGLAYNLYLHLNVINCPLTSTFSGALVR